jgi:hypothetical protein
MTEPMIPEDPRVRRQQALATYLSWALGIVLGVAALTAVAPRSWIDTLGPIMVGLLVAAPVGRVLWLLARWTHRGDRRFAFAVVLLLVVMTIALLVSR